MIVLNHVAMAARNLYEAAYALRLQTGLGYYDGGFNEGGQGNKIFPLGGGSYIQLHGVADAWSDAPGALRIKELVRNGEQFESLNLRGEVSDLQAIADRHGLRVVENPGGRVQANGEHQRVISISATPPGMPPVYAFPEIPLHPSSYPPDYAPGLVKPRGITFVELGGAPAALEDWIGAPAASALPLRFNGRAPGVYAIGVATDAGDVTITVPFRRGAA